MGFKYGDFYFKLYFRHFNPVDEAGRQLKKAKKRGTECVVSIDGLPLASGWAKCGKSDNFSKEVGRYYAMERTLEKLSPHIAAKVKEVYDNRS